MLFLSVEERSRHLDGIKLIKRLGYGRLTFSYLTARIVLKCGHSP
jgi:hypothetical protein